MKEAEIRPQELFNRYLELSLQDVATHFSNQSEFVQVSCPACGSGQEEPALEKCGFRYALCTDCGSLYVSPRPKAEAIDSYYREGEAVKFWSTSFFKETAEARRERIFRPRAKLVTELTRKALTGSPERAVFVDVGSGYGIFLEEIRALGLFGEVVGIEPAPNLAGVCRDKGFRILEKPAEEVSAEELQASFATAFEVLEHLYDPARFLRALYQILEPGGVLLFTTLTASGFDIQILWEHSKSVHPPHHLNLISVKGMRLLVERCGFQIVELSTPGELDVDIVRNILAENHEIPVPRFVRQIVCNQDEQVANRFQHFLKESNLSSHIRVVAVRPLADNRK